MHNYIHGRPASKAVALSLDASPKLLLCKADSGCKALAGKHESAHRIAYYVGAASPRTAASTDAVSRWATESDPAPTKVPGSGAAPRRGRFAAGAADASESGT